MDKKITPRGIVCNPELPDCFWETDIKDYDPEKIGQWRTVPFIITVENDLWPEGIRYDVYFLNGGTEDRPTPKGKYGSIEEAENLALELSGPAAFK